MGIVDFKIIKTRVNIPMRQIQWPRTATENGIVMQQYKILEHEKQPNGEVWYSVRVNDDILLWLNETFEYETDFRVVHHLKGVWVGMNEKTLALLQLKWS